jgi:catechol 2,3-dioxygenase-like lactoylglutathione lyase family enzyme
MVRVVGIDHLVLRVGDFERSKAFYEKVLGALGFKLKYDSGDTAGWSNGKTLFWIGQADAQGKKHRHRAGNIGFHHYAFELSKRTDVDDFYQALKRYDVNVVDPPGDYYEGGYYAVYFLDPDGMKLEAMVFDPKGLRAAQARAGKPDKKTPGKKRLRRKRRQR